MTTDFQTMLDEATKAANNAGIMWLYGHIGNKYIINDTDSGVFLTDLEGNRINPILDCCGGAYIKITDRRTKFAKWMAKNKNAVTFVDIRHKFGGWQDMGLRETAELAAYNVLKHNYGITGISVHSYID